MASHQDSNELMLSEPTLFEDLLYFKNIFSFLFFMNDALSGYSAESHSAIMSSL